MLVADPRNPVARALAERLHGLVTDGVVVVLGGDGFLLHTIASHGFDRTYLGLNAGRIGFLMNDADDPDAVRAAIEARAWSTTSFPVLEATARFTDGTERVLRAINDVALERSTGQTAHLSLAVDGRTVVDPLVADGLLFATALGSTAYTFSAGGPACHPTLGLLAVTAICPHHPRLAPFVLPDSASASVEVRQVERRPVRVVADGVATDGVVGLSVRVGAPRVNLAWLGGPDFTARMVTKILRP